MGKRLTQKEFLIRAEKIHGDRFDYSLVEYVGINSKIKIICYVHGIFEQDPYSHLIGNGCQKCARIIVGDKLSNNTNNFIDNAKKVHGNLFDYNLVVYKNNRVKIKILCKIHGEFEQRPISHLNGHGCPFCGAESRNNKLSNFFRKDALFYIDKANIIYNFFYDYKLVEYISSIIKVKIICPIHGIFEQTFNGHVNGKRGCQKCAGNILINNDDFIEKVKNVHGNLYNYKLVNYRGAHIKIIIICIKHGEFEQEPSVHIKGHGCPRCVSTISKIEIKWLDYINLPNEFRHKTIRFNNKYYLVDGFNHNTNVVYEFYGDYWHGNPRIYNAESIHPVSKISYGKLYEKTLQRENIIRLAGYNIISIWEYDFKKLLINGDKICP